MDQHAVEAGFVRHVRDCNNARLPGERCPILIGQARIGWASPAIAAALREFDTVRPEPDGMLLTDPVALPEIARVLSGRGMFRWRSETFDVRADPHQGVLSQIDRGALPAFGIQAQGVHVNGLVERPQGLHLWVARRAMNKALDPGKLDHIVAGGIPSGLGPMETLIKEAAEEASIPSSLASSAVRMSTLQYAMERAEGLRRDYLHCYDLTLPPSFTPVAADGEVEAFELWPLERVAETVRTTNYFKFNVNLVLIDLFIRKGLIKGADAIALRAALTDCGGSAAVPET